MIFQVLLLIQLCLSLSQASILSDEDAKALQQHEATVLTKNGITEHGRSQLPSMGSSEQFKLNTYGSDTLIFMNFRPRQQWELCDCDGGKCKPKPDAGAELCQQIQKRFVTKADPNQYLMFCELVPMTCTRQQKTAPDFVRVRITVDTWYYLLAPFYHGGNTGPRAFPSLLKSGRPGTSILAENMTVEVAQSRGVESMPLEFKGILNLPATDAEKYYYCTTETCINTVNQLCSEVVKAVNVTNPVLMQHFKGCTVRHIYPVDQNLGIFWSIMVDYRRMIPAKKLTSKQDIENQMQIIKENMKLPSILKSFEPIRIVPLDYCDITAQTLTNQKYQEDMAISVSSIYKTTSTKYYSDLIRQLTAGEDQKPSCFRHAFELQLFKQGSNLRVHTRLFYSLTCYKQRGVNTCADVTKQVASMWNKGSKLLPSEMGTNYSFQLLYNGHPMN